MKDGETGPTEVVEPMEIAAIDVETVVTEDVTTDEETATSVVQSLEGTWILNVDDAQISMVIYQSEDTLFGAANSEVPKPWNAVVFGSASGDDFARGGLSLEEISELKKAEEVLIGSAR